MKGIHFPMMSINIIVPMDEEQLALTMNGKKRNIRKKDFIVFAQICGIPEKAALKMMKKLIIERIDVMC